MRYILSLLLILISIEAHAFSAAIQAVLGVSTVSPYIFEENFNVSGYEKSWTPAGTVIDPDYATAPAPLEGAQSLAINPSDDYPSIYSEDFTAQSHIYGYMMFNIAGWGTGLGGYPFGFAKAGGGDLGYLSTSGGVLQCNFPGGTADAGSTTIDEGGDTTYHLWVECQAASETPGNDGIFRLWLSTTTTKPETVECEVTNGATTGNIGRVTIVGSTGAQDNFYVIDKVRLSTSPIGSNPQ